MIIVLYMPVVHQGYLNFLRQHADDEIVVLDEHITQAFKPLRKDIRALAPFEVVEILQALKIGEVVTLGDQQKLAELNHSGQEIAMPNEEPMQEIAAEYLADAQVIYTDVFLRWDKSKSKAEESLDQHQATSSNAFDQKMMAVAEAEAAKSVDQWRQVGGVVVKGKKILLKGRNHHLPDDYQPVYAGDLRGNFSSGEHIDLTSAQHAEATLVAQAAHQGISLKGAEMYVTTFPCPVCAKLVAESGIKTLFFKMGYSMADGKRTMEEMGVRLVRVEQGGTSE